MFAPKRRIRGITVVKQAGIGLTAEQWELYTESQDCRQAAIDINRAIEEAFNQGLDKPEVATAALRAMLQHSDCGAMDSEPLRQLEEVLDALFPGGGQ